MDNLINKALNMDALDLLKKIPDKSIDIVIADPPYGISYHSGYYKYGNKHKKIIGDDKLDIPLDLMFSKLKHTGAMFIFYSQKVPLIDERIKDVLIWVKNNWSAGDLKGTFANQYEPIAFLPNDKFSFIAGRPSNIIQIELDML